MPPDLPPDYYLRNFQALVDNVATRYGDLLSPEEQDWLDRYRSSSVDARCLYVRLLSRTRSVFRRDKLDYPEIGDLHAAADELTAAGLMSIDPALDLDDLLPLYVKAELAEACAEPAARKCARDALVDALLDDPDSLGFERASLAAHGPLLQVEDEDYFTVFRLLFFGNLYQDLSDFVLRDLGLMQYEAYPIDADSRAFTSREQIDAHLRYYAVRAMVDNPNELDTHVILALHEVLPSAPPTDRALYRRVGRFCNELARALERRGDTDQALALYATTDWPPSRERRARVLAATEQEDAALALCQAIAGDPIDADEAEFATGFAQRLLRKLGRRGPVPKALKPDEISLELTPDAEASVEVCAARFYAEDGACHYTENSLFTGVFGLAFWDIIFSPIPGAFHNPFQHAPADFREPDFRDARAAAVGARLDALLQPGDLKRRVRATFEAKQGTANPAVHWAALSEDLLDTALERIPLAHWHGVFDRMLEDLGNYRAGFPDLVHFPAEGGYNLIEVKGPGDTLQKNQLRWMAYFSTLGIPHVVAHVTWLDAPVTA
ncbi:MAG: VRR-NUC domain-containing protein [Pseudomonadota bacterium]